MESLSSYAMAIIGASFVMNLIQMILPEGNTKKYIVFVCGVVVVLLLISPVISFFHQDFDISQVLAGQEEHSMEIESETYETYYEQQVKNAYQSNIQNDIIERLRKAGYKAEKMEIEYDEITKEPKHLRVTITASDGTVQPVRIEVLAGLSAMR